MHLKVRVNSNPTGETGWDTSVMLSTGTVNPSLTDWDIGSLVDVALIVDTAFTNEVTVALTSGSDIQGWPSHVWNSNNYSDGAIPDPPAVFRLTGSVLTPGNSYRLLLAGTWDADRDVEYTVNGVSAVYDNQTQAGRPYIPEPQAEIIAVATDDGSGNGVLEVTSGYGPGSERNYLAGFEVFDSAPSTIPAITDINTNNEVTPGTTATITGTNLSNTTGVTVGGEAQTSVTVVSATEVTFTVERGGNPYNQDLTAELTSTDGTANITVQQVPESGFAVTAQDPNTVDAASLWTGLVDTVTGDPVTIVNGDQAWIKTTLAGLSVDPDGTITANETGSFTVQIWLQSEGVWGSDQTVQFEEGIIADIGGLMRNIRAVIKSNLKSALRR